MTRRQAFETSIERIKDCEARLVALDYAVSTLRDRRLDGPARVEYQAIRSALHEHLLDAYRNLLTFGILVPDEMQDRARLMVLRRFLKEGSAIMHYLQLDGELPGQWACRDEDEFRAELAKFREEEERREAEKTHAK